MSVDIICVVYFLCEGYCDRQYLHVLTHSFPTRLSSDLFLTLARCAAPGRQLLQHARQGSPFGIGLLDRPLLLGSRLCDRSRRGSRSYRSRDEPTQVAVTTFSGQSAPDPRAAQNRVASNNTRRSSL